jgi:hypothetical protein
VPLAFYVYYRVDPVAADAARARVDALFDRLEQRCGVRGRLLTKRGEPHLWMEVYEGVSDAAGFESTLEAEAAGLGLDALLRAGNRRTVEAFED